MILEVAMKKNPHVISQDEDLQRAIVKMDVKEVKSWAAQGSQDYQEEDEEEEVSTKRMKVGKGANY